MTIDALTEDDDDIRPQDDLYGYVNGGWLATAEIPPDLTRIGGFIDLHLEAEADVGDILREASDASAAGTAPASPWRHATAPWRAKHLPRPPRGRATTWNSSCAPPSSPFRQ